MDVTQIEAAKRQLATAIALYFEDRDPVSVHTLVMAAGEIIDRLCASAGRASWRSDLLARAEAVGRRKEISDALNGPRNFFKHGSDSTNILTDFSDERNLVAIIVAADGLRLLGELTVETKTFGAWLAVVDPDLLQTAPVDEAIVPVFGNIRNQSRAEQKKIGRDALSVELTGRLPA